MFQLLRMASMKLIIGLLLASLTFAVACPTPAMTVVMVTAMWQREPGVTEVETAIALKSIVHSLRCDANFVFVVTAYEVPLLRAMLQPLVNPGIALNYSFTLIDEDVVLRKARELEVPITHHSGVPGYAKFLLPELLLSNDQILLLDTDMIVGSDLTMLWNEFDLFTDETLFAFPGRPDWFCSCIGLMHLSRMRDTGWTSSFAKAAFDAYKHNVSGFGGQHANHLTTHGDQSMLILVTKYYRDHADNRRAIFKSIPPSWNLDKCGNYLGVTPTNPKLPWGAIHFNCNRAVGGKTMEDRIKPWDVIYRFYDQLPWVWLNGGRTARTVAEVGR